MKNINIFLEFAIKSPISLTWEIAIKIEVWLDEVQEEVAEKQTKINEISKTIKGSTNWRISW